MNRTPSHNRPRQMPAAPAPMQRSHGEARLSVVARNGQTRISELFQEGCAKIRLPRTHAPALEAVLLNTAGGLTGGDSITWTIDAAPGTALVLTTQACERIYRSEGADAEVRTTITVGAGAHVDWLPQETILFEHSRLDRRLVVELAEGASFTGIEAVLLGREAMGETARGARINDQWRIHREGRLLHAEANLLTAEDLERDAISLLAGHSAFATVLHAAADAEAKLEMVRALAPLGAKLAVSAIGERLVVRALAPSGLALRRIITPVIAALSGTGTLPRLWST